MSRFLVMGQYSKQGLSSAADAGLASREEVLRPAIESSGGSLEQLWFCPSYSGFDFVMLVTTTSEAIFSMSLNTATSPAFEREMTVIELRSGEEADSALLSNRSPDGYKGPGQQ